MIKNTLNQKFSRNPSGISTVYFLFCVLFTFFISSGYQSNYFPGTEDIAILSQSKMYGVWYWINTGYFDWFDSNYDFPTKQMYEIRPLTHAYSYVLATISNGQLSDFSSVHWIMLICVFGALYSSYFLMKSLEFSPIALFVGGLLFIVFNPCTTFELFVDASFIQVSLSIILFSMIGVFISKKRLYPLLIVIFLSAILKESTFYFGVMAAIIWVTIYRDSKLIPIAILCSYFIPFVLLHLNTHHDQLESAMVVFDGHTSIAEKIINAANNIVDSLSKYPLSIFFSGEQSISLTKILLILANLWILSYLSATLLFFQKNSNVKILFVMFAFSYGSFLVFNSQLRWGWEYSLMLSLVASHLMTSKNTIKTIVGVSMIASWSIFGVQNTIKIYEDGKKELGGKSDLLIYKPYTQMLRDLNKQGVKLLYVINDPTDINAKYINYFSGTDIEIIRATEIALKGNKIHSEVSIDYSENILRIDSLVSTNYAVIERVNISDILLNSFSMNGLDYSVAINGDLVRYEISGEPTEEFAVASFDPTSLTYVVRTYTPGMKSQVDASYYTSNNISEYSLVRKTTVSCKDVSASLLGRGSIKIQSVFNGVAGLPSQLQATRSIIKNISDYEDGYCLIEIDRDEAIKYKFERMVFIDGDRPVDMIRLILRLKSATSHALERRD